MNEDESLMHSRKSTYKEKLVCSNTPSFSVNFSTPIETSSILPEVDNIFDSDDFIPLIVEEKLRLYKPWAKALIIKVFGKHVGYKYLIQKLHSLWNLLRISL